MEYISSPIATTQFKQNLFASLSNARNSLAEYWGKDNENWLKFISTFIDIENHFETVLKLQHLENEAYANDACERGMISMVKALEAFWVFSNSLNPDYLNYATLQSEEMIRDIMTGENKPGENDIYFFSLSIDTEINIFEVDAEHKIAKKTYNQGKENLMNFLELNESFYPLFSYEQIYYEKNKEWEAIIKPIKTVVGEKWPIENLREIKDEREKNAKNSEVLKNIIGLFLKEKEISSYPWQALGKIKGLINGFSIFDDSDLKLLNKAIEEKECQYCCALKDIIILECHCRVCKEDLLASIKHFTNGLILLNNWEKENQKEFLAKCPICEKLLDDKTIELILADPDYFQSLKQASLDRELIQNPPKVQCKCCLEEKLEKMFFKTDEVNCTHVCWECMLENIRRNNLECPECQIKYTDSFISTVKSWKLSCYVCKELKSLSKEFSGIFCKNHKILCLSCLNLCYEFKNCISCNSKQFEEAELEKLKEMLHKECRQCGKPYSRLESLENKDCFCNVCENCQCESIDYCIICNKEFTDRVKDALRQKKNEKDEEERGRKERMRQCGVCQETVMIEKMRALECNHYFCETCLKDMLKYYIENRQLDNATRCPHDNCKHEIFTGILESILSYELWDKLNQFLIDQRMNMINCPNCKERFAAPLSRKAVCLNCNCEFCKTCSEVWHEELNCEEIYVQRRIKEMEDAGEVMSQCPGCKQPYIKDDHCEHVVCMNPKCKTVFCFTCACLRSPTMEHGNHYHRPDCKWFAPLPAADKDRYMPNSCDECKRLGELCKPPMKLAMPRKFAPGEI